MGLRIQDINHLIGIESPWEISEIKQDKTAFTAEIHVTCSKGSVLRCVQRQLKLSSQFHGTNGVFVRVI